MRKKLFTVTDTFQIKGIGCVIVGKTSEKSPIIKVGDSLSIIKPDGEKIFTTIQQIPIVCRKNKNLDSIPLEITDLKKEDVPIGSTIFVEVD